MRNEKWAIVAMVASALGGGIIGTVIDRHIPYSSNSTVRITQHESPAGKRQIVLVEDGNRRSNIYVQPLEESDHYPELDKYLLSIENPYDREIEKSKIKKAAYSEPNPKTSNQK